MGNISAIVLWTFLLAGPVAQAQESVSSTFPQGARPTQSQLVPHIGVLMGMARPDGSPNTGEIGVNIGFQPYIPFGLGAEVTYFKSDGDRDVERTQALITATYNFGGSSDLLRHTYFGVGGGAAFNSDGTDLVSAPLLGFDIPIRSKEKTVMSIGAVAKYAFVEGSAKDALSLDGVVKYWF